VYLTPAPRVRLEHLADLRDTERITLGGRTPSPISYVLQAFGHVARGFSPRAALYVQKSPSGVVATQRLVRAFGRQKTQAPPYPSTLAVRRFGTVSECPHQQARSCAVHVLSFLPWPFVGPSPKRVFAPVAHVAMHELPTLAALSEPNGTFTRIAQE
jgi:hypothetical protein